MKQTITTKCPRDGIGSSGRVCKLLVGLGRVDKRWGQEEREGFLGNDI